MNEEINIIDEYKKLNTNEKRKEIADEFIELIAVVKKLKTDFNIPSANDNDILKELYNGTNSEDDYLVSIYKNVLNLKDELAEYLTVVVDNLYEENE